MGLLIADYVILFVLMLLLSYIFEDKIIPNLAVMFLAVMQTIIYTNTSLTTNYTSAFPVFLYIINIFYAIIKIGLPGDKENEYSEVTE